MVAPHRILPCNNALIKTQKQLSKVADEKTCHQMPYKGTLSKFSFDSFQRNEPSSQLVTITT